jgi:hypothetical protein
MKKRAMMEVHTSQTRTRGRARTQGFEGAIKMEYNRRDFMRLAGLGGIVLATGVSGLGRADGADRVTANEFSFVQLSDTHWGFDGARVNPDAQGTLKKAVAAVNGLEVRPDFVVFTGDLTHTTDDLKLRRERMKQFREIAGGLKVKTIHFLPGEHDASLDRGEAYQEHFGDLHYAFDHKGVHFIALDNVSDPEAVIGDSQTKWLQADLKGLKRDAPIVVLTHRPLFDLYPQWDWTTGDAVAVIESLMPYQNVTVFYGHIHQQHHYKTGHIAHHSAKSLMFALPAPGSVPKKAPVPWNAATPYAGLGWRDIKTSSRNREYQLSELTLTKG